MCIRFNHDRTFVEQFCSEMNIWVGGTPVAIDASRPDPEDAFPGDLAYMAVADAEHGRKLVESRFGIYSAYGDKTKGRSKWLHNARAETVAELKSFARHFREHRCVVPAPAFFEQYQGRWLRMRPSEGAAFAVASIYDPAEGTHPASFAMVTTEPNLRISDVHDRMPVVLAPADVELWLRPDAHLGDLEALLTPCPEEWLVIEDAGPNSRPKKAEQTKLF